jgi:hypothetical protein
MLQSSTKNPEKLATQGTQNEDKQSKKHNTKCVGHTMRTQTQIRNKDMSLPTNN